MGATQPFSDRPGSRAAALLDRVFGIPHLSPAAAALFRIAFGSALLWLLWGHSGLDEYDRALFPEPGTGYGTGQLAVAHWLRAHPASYQAVHVAALAGAFAVSLGIVTRVAAIWLWIALFLLISAKLVTTGQHAWGAPLIAIGGLAFARLGDAWSVDAAIARARGRERPTAPGPVYGFAVWWIGFVLGVVFLAAAWAKLRTSGFAWIASGAVGYHFLEDAGNAIVPWGLWIAGRPSLAVALSAAALLIEALLVFVIFFRTERARLAFGCMGLSLQVGIYLLQGVLWRPWLLLYLAFLPWETMARSLHRGPGIVARHPARARLGWAHLAIVAALTTSQVYASAARVEHEPLLSHYPMYSGTWPSREAFFAVARWSKYQSYRFAATDDTGRRVDAPSHLIRPNDYARLIDAIRSLCTGSPPTPDDGTFEVLARRLSAHAGHPVDRLEVVVDIRDVDFDRMRIVTRVADLHALTIRLSTGTLEFVAPAFNPPCVNVPAAGDQSPRSSKT